MKKLLLVLALALPLLAACGGRQTTDKECDSTWRQLDVSSDIQGIILSKLLNEKQIPGTVGEYLQQCLEEGWKGY